MEDLLTAIFGYIDSGGAVMVPIMLCSLVLWGLIFERLIVYRNVEKHDLDLGAALALVRKGETGPELPGLRRDLVRFMAEYGTESPKVNRGLLHQYRLQKRPHLTRRIGLIATLAAVAPLLGLLGTVSGMITTFDVIALFGTGNARAMAGGISESLITTQSGLSVAIPGMFMGVLLMRRAHRLSAKLDETISIIQRSMT
ncbi:MotA/TolQ/ExbB proton channel family protein [Desulfoluna spongiiphila]|uniref:Outer membrane transport energization protein ExbB n=1 Tax=Desulfoluna spongiiphila TaxID=419481 RepID=A0A1G5HA07_9BACT|nr:MotA/TolQ/ExbB proton channel family protein [Desulfoluna spongiiphila]SCY60180.1 outer membrane transport energization protein ExbB [Desulfoluna spongiiphila]VVS94526.1 mota/tolq/exbb proton channel [Desulfoluna spongiiphila]